MSDVLDRLKTALSDRYAIEREIGAGGMATVYLAQDIKHHRPVAVKVLRPELAALLGGQRFLREIEVTANLHHPHILPLYDSGEADGFLYYVMPFVEGESLRDRLNREKQLPLDDALQFAREVADALGYAHSRGVIHRDIKPDNIMLHSGHAVVADFGIARAVGAADGEKLTATGIAIGTPSYMSPEQSTGEDVDVRSDIYALGSVLYEMLGGEPPYTGPTAQAIIAKRLVDPIPDVRVLRETVPDNVQQAITSALAKSPADRFSTADRFSEALTIPDGVLAGGSAGRPMGQGAKHNLPLAADSFVGREEEIEEITGAIEEVRLLTITGVGGTGKTRLALQAAERMLPQFKGGVWLAELAAVLEPNAVPHVIADAIGTRQMPGKTIIESVVQSLELRNLLLIIDNCEHVLDTVAEIASAVLAQCPDVRILATSREGLAVRGERVVSLTSLSVDQGVDLFRDRARDAGGGGELNEETLARLSQRLDGIPLAIELAAARCRTMSPEEIESRLDDCFRLLRGNRRGRMERHQTLRNAVAWSYDLLDPTEQKVFDRLSVFAGGFTLEAAVSVAIGEDIDELDGEDAVTALVERSMLVATSTEDGTWYRLLETLRQFGEGQLVESGESEIFKDRHLAWYVGFSERAFEGQWSPDDEPWWRAIEREFENLRMAFYSAIKNNDREAASAIATAAYDYGIHWYRLEMVDWFLDALSIDPEPALVRPLAEIYLVVLGRIEEADRISGWRDDETEEWSIELTVEVFVRFAARTFRGDAAGSEPWSHRAIALSQDDRFPTGHHIHIAAAGLWQQVHSLVPGRADEARLRSVSVLRKAEQHGNTFATASAHFGRGRALADTEPVEALHHFERSIALYERIGERFIKNVGKSEAAAIAVQISGPHEALGRIVPALRNVMDGGDLPSLWTSAHHLALLLVRLNRKDVARTVWQELGERWAHTAHYHRDELTRDLGEPGDSEMSDLEFTKYLKNLIDELESESEASPAP